MLNASFCQVCATFYATLMNRPNCVIQFRNNIFLYICVMIFICMLFLLFQSTFGNQIVSGNECYECEHKVDQKCTQTPCAGPYTPRLPTSIS